MAIEGKKVSDLFLTQTQNIVNPAATVDFTFAGQIPIAQAPQDLSSTDALLQMMQANITHSHASSPFDARSPSLPTSRSLSSSPFASRTVTPGSPQLSPAPGNPSNEATVSRVVGHERNRYSETAEELSNDLLAVKPAKKIGLSAISNYLGPTKRNERNMSLPKMLTAPTGSITHQLQGLPEWTQEIAADYGTIFEKYGKLQLEVEYSLELVTPPVLTAEEQVKKRAEAVEHENNCALYKDPQQSIRSSLFNQRKPGFPQGVWNTATVRMLFKTFHTNSGVKNDQGLLDKMWDEIREEKGSEY
ncbi:unnamed protein product [Caenorhabditis brenneri]